MNITNAALIQTLTDQLSVQEASIAQLQMQLASGHLFSRASDNPVAVTQILSLSSQVSQLSSWHANADIAKSWLGAATSVANNVIDSMQVARTLLLQAANQGAQNSVSYEAIGSKIQGIVSNLQLLSNTEYGGRGIFVGTSASPQAYDANGNYLGNSDIPTVVIGPGPGAGQTVGLSVPGTAMFGVGSSNVFSTLTTVANALLTGTPSSTQISNALSALDSNISTAQKANAILGNSSLEVSNIASTLTNQIADIQTSQANLGDVNVAKVTTQLDLEMTNYQAALWAASRAIPETLAKFVAP